MLGYIATGSDIMTIKHDSQGELQIHAGIKVYDENILIQTLEKDLWLFGDGVTNITGFSYLHKKGFNYQIIICLN